jgi:uncharacterized damage-inducible protein DinB
MLDRSVIDRFEAGGDAVVASFQGLSRADLLAFPIPGKMSIQQVIIHIADSDMVLLDRMKRVITHHNPPLLGFDENAYLKELHYDEQSVSDAAMAMKLNRLNFARALRKLPDEAFERIGIHNERGPMKLIDILIGTTNHATHHLKFVAEKRAKLGK